MSDDWSVSRILEMSYETMTRIILFTYKWFRMILDLVGFFYAKLQVSNYKENVNERDDSRQKNQHH